MCVSVCEREMLIDSLHLVLLAERNLQGRLLCVEPYSLHSVSFER